jgi:hypothetical protein
VKAEQALERRYRLLLACYPPSYRAAYGEEMLAVALAASGPGQRWPDAGEAADLIVSGVRRRLGSLRPGPLSPAWPDAAAILTVIGPIVMAAFAVRPLPMPFRGVGAWQYFGVASFGGFDVAALWSAIAIAAMLRWRWLALAGSCVLSAGLAFNLVLGAASDPYQFGASEWKVVLATVITGSALVALKSEHRPISWLAATATAAVAALLAILPALEKAPVWPGATSPASFAEMSSYMQTQAHLSDALPAGLVLVLLAVAARQKAAVRSRMLVVLVPAAATLAFDIAAYSGVLSIEYPRTYPPLGPGWWQSPAVLVAVPVLCFFACLAWLTRHERKLRRQDVTGVPA